jgi:hypothetical protein
VTLDDARAVAIEALEQASTTDLKRLLRQRTLERVPDLEAWLTPG